MNNVELEELKRQIMEYFGSQKLAREVGFMNDKKLLKLKKELEKLKEKKAKTHKEKMRKRQLEDRIKLNYTVKAGEKFEPSKEVVIKPNEAVDNGVIVAQNIKVSVPVYRKPKILFMADVKNWAWWIKSKYLEKYLSDEYDIDVVCVVGPGCISHYNIPANDYDLYFTFGYTYVDYILSIPRFKRVTGVTAHRARHVIQPQMKKAGNIHANSMMLYNELIAMGYSKVHYLPNGVDVDLFRVVEPIQEKRQRIIVGHVGKECPQKGQREYIYPAIKKSGAESITNVVTWQNKIPHDQMYKIYQKMDVFIVASTEDGTPNPALEAASCGRPIISNRIGNMPEFIEDGVNGFLVNRNVDEYVEKITWLQNNRDKMIKMGQKARETVEKYWTWEIQSENYRNMFKEIFVKEGE